VNRRWFAAIGPVAWLVIASLFLAAALDLDPGTARRLGPGAYPMAASGLLAGLSLVLAVTAFASGPPPQRADWGPTFAICLSLAAFATLTPLLGVLPAAFCAVVAASLPDRELSWPGKIVLAVVVAAGVWAIFIVGLRLPFTAFRGI
jgi:hypothetical protein